MYLPGRYDNGLVVLSIIVAIFASYTALDLARRVSLSKGRIASLIWLFGGSFVMGTGIWSMHFVGMLAFSLPITLGYDTTITLVSMAIAVVVSLFALFIVSRERLAPSRLVLGGVLMGLGICGMHYTGMAAMRMEPGIDYEPRLFGASVLIAISAAMAALWICFTLSRRTGRWLPAGQLAAAMVMGAAISGMHYTAMAAAHFPIGSVCLAAGTLDNVWLAYTIAGVTFGILIATLLVSVVDARMESNTATLAASLKAANAELTRMALHDPLTGLPNRSLLEDRIKRAVAACQRSGALLAVAFIDLDGFKAVNDTLGHRQGDLLLREIAQRLCNTVRAEDTVARLGGDEFVVILKQLANPTDAAGICRKITEAIARPVALDTETVQVTSSIGVALYPADGITPEALLTHADAAMYHVKSVSRNDFAYYRPEMNHLVHNLLTLQNALRQALEQQEFELHYQPKIDLRSGRIVGVEALLRWRRSKQELVAPQEFIAVAEQSGLIIDIGAWVINEACRQNQQWRARGLPHLSTAINLSVKQFRHQQLIGTISRALATHQLPPSALLLELTETAAMEHAPSAQTLLSMLAKLGLSIAIDDFGTGYSSLAYLKRFPIVQLKVDRSFIREVTQDSDDRTIVQVIIGLAHSLKMTVVAEGVETPQQQALLENLGCDQTQGFLYAPAMPAAEFEAWLARVGRRTETVRGEIYLESVAGFGAAMRPT